MLSLHRIATCALLLLTVPAFAETVADRKGAVLSDRANLENDPRWIYNDYEQGFAEGKRTGKPVLIVLRCIPCLACAGIEPLGIALDERANAAAAGEVAEIGRAGMPTRVLVVRTNEELQIARETLAALSRRRPGGHVLPAGKSSPSS